MSRNNSVCANCRCDIRNARSLGESAIYQRGDSEPIDLCEPCFHKEDAFIEEQGTNDLPDVLQQYWINLGGRGPFRIAIPLSKLNKGGSDV